MEGWGARRAYFDASLKICWTELSMSAWIKARIKLIRSADDDQFELLEVLAVPLL